MEVAILRDAGLERFTLYFLFHDRPRNPISLSYRQRRWKV